MEKSTSFQSDQFLSQDRVKEFSGREVPKRSIFIDLEIDKTKYPELYGPSDGSSDGLSDESSSDDNHEPTYMAEVEDYVLCNYDDENVKQIKEGESEKCPEHAPTQQSKTITIDQAKRYLPYKPSGPRARSVFEFINWPKPRRGRFRVDTDGSMKVYRKKDDSMGKVKGGIGAIARDGMGKVICAASDASEPVSVLYHKLQAVKKGIYLARLCSSHGHGLGLVYCDSLVAMTLINFNAELYSENEEDDAQVREILAEIHTDREKAKAENLDLKILQSNRWENAAADYLSKLFKPNEIVEPRESGEELKKLVSEKFGEELMDIISKDERGEGHKCGE